MYKIDVSLEDVNKLKEIKPYEKTHQCLFIRDGKYHSTYVNINTLEELIKLGKVLDVEIIINDGEIEIERNNF